MKYFRSSIALRLTIWFLLLSFLPLIVMAVFVRRNVTNSFEQAAISAQRDQARLNAAYMAEAHYEADVFNEHLLHNQPASGEHFVVDGGGTIIFHPNPAFLGSSLLDVFDVETVEAIIGQESGGVIDSRAGRIVGFSRIREKNDWVDIVAVDTSTLLGVTNQLTNISSLQLGISLVIISFVGGLVIWFVVGSPLRSLTRAAQNLGRQNLSVEFDTSGMEDELGILARTIIETQTEIRSLVTGLETQVRELDLAYISLRESEERYRTIFDSMNDAILVHNLESDEILDVNKKFFDMYGYQSDETRSLTMKDLIADTESYSFENMLHVIRQVKRGGPQVFEWYARRKDGSFFWVEINMRAASLDSEEQRLVIVVRDIDQRKRNEQVQVAIYRIAQIAQAKPSLYEFFTAVHQVLQTLIPCPNLIVALYRGSERELHYPYHLDEREIWPGAQAGIDGLLLKAMNNSDGALWVTSENLEDYLVGTEVPSDLPPVVFHDWLGVPLQTAHGLLGALVMKYYNTTARPSRADLETLSLISVQVAAALERKLAEEALRESEARWRTLMKSSPQLIMTVNRSGQILFINRPLDDFLGETNSDAEIFHFLPGLTLESKKEMLQKVFNERTSVSFEFSVTNAVGHEFWFSANLAPVIDRGRVDLAIFNAMDITVRKTAENQVLSLNDELEQRVKERTSLLEAANQELESFSYSVSHDLRAPLRAINGFSRILEEEFENGSLDSRRRYLGLIRENAQQMGLLIDDLLSFSRIGRQQINMQAIPIYEIVQQVIYTLDHEIENRQVEIVLPKDMPECIGDAMLIKQVWINLLANALKFTRLRDQARIEIGFEQRKAEVIYSVRDNGTGFDMQYADKLFGVFQRLHRPEDFEGTGVGLAIVHRIVTKHGGKVWAESEIDHGATFFFSLPSKSKKSAKK